MTGSMHVKFQFVTSRGRKDGSLRYYYQKRGMRPVRLPDDPTSPAFAAAYQAAHNRRPEGKAPSGSFAWVCDQYLDSPKFGRLEAATRAARTRIIRSMTAERIDPAHRETFGQEKFTRLTRRHIVILRDRKADAPNAANERLKILSQIYKFALQMEWTDANPVRDVERVQIASDGHRTATDADLSAYLARHRSGPANLSMRLMMAFGVRVSDLRRLGPANIQGAHLVFRTVKTDMMCELAIPPDLMPVLKSCSNMVFLTTEHGSAFASDKAMSARVAKWFRQAGIDGVTAHGVRKWLATKQAAAGATEYQMMAFFGWRDPKEARPYIAKANRRVMADEASARVARLTRQTD